MFNSNRLVLLGTSIVGSISSYVYIQNDDGSKRSLTFWVNIFPIYLHYRTIQFLNRDTKIISDKDANKIYESLHLKYTDKVRDLTFSLRGFYLKNAQLLSMQDDFVPEAYMKWAKLCQDSVPSEYINEDSKNIIIKYLKDELKLDFNDVFESFDYIPIGVASIGQVHKGILSKDYCIKKYGKILSLKERAVAIKFIYPNIEKKFRSDINTLKQFCRISMVIYIYIYIYSIKYITILIT